VGEDGLAAGAGPMTPGPAASRATAAATNLPSVAAPCVAVSGANSFTSSTADVGRRGRSLCDRGRRMARTRPVGCTMKGLDGMAAGSEQCTVPVRVAGCRMALHEYNLAPAQEASLIIYLSARRQSAWPSLGLFFEGVGGSPPATLPAAPRRAPRRHRDHARH
jgi:hypothetical protein